MITIIGKSRNNISMGRPISVLLLSIFILFQNDTLGQYKSEEVIPGAERMNLYLPLLKQKRVAIVANHASFVGNKHLLDTL